MSKTYCVVGGGISGLVAAYRLRQADPAARITVFSSWLQLKVMVT